MAGPKGRIMWGVIRHLPRILISRVIAYLFYVLDDIIHLDAHSLTHLVYSNTPSLYNISKFSDACLDDRPPDIFGILTKEGQVNNNTFTHCFHSSTDARILALLLSSSLTHVYL